MSDTTTQRIRSLDGLRGLAVISVIAFHYLNNQIPDGSWLIRTFGKPAIVIQKATYFGWTGVNLFFILSGFLIGNILLKNRNSPNYFRAFYVRRFCRIIPPYYLLLIVYLCLTLTRFYNSEAYIFESHLPIASYFGFIQNFYMAWRNTFGPQALTPTWSLCVEEQFYLIIPFLVLFIKPKYAWVMVLAGCIIAIYSRHLATNFYEGYVLLPSRIDSPMIGFLIALLHQEEKYKSWISNHLRIVYVLLFVLLIFCGGLFHFSDPGIFSHTLLALVFALLVTLALYSRKGAYVNILSLSSLVYVGKLSYFLYLFHQLINGFLHLIILKHLDPVLSDPSSIGVTSLALFLTFAFAEISYRWFEGPIIAFSHRFAYQRSKLNIR